MSKISFKVRYLRTMLMFALTLAIMNPTVAFARADRPNAVADIMNDQRFTGAIDSISWLTGRIDHWFTIIITITAFFIISSALLKNTCAGAYCANHKFWDKVAEAHEHAEAASIMSVVQGIKGIPNMSAGSMKEAILCIVPNIKAFTDFDDADIEPRQYFMKAIPQMLACVMIGVFIYNGYYRDTAAMVGSMGSEICVRVFASVDPSTFLDKITQTTKTPPNIFKDDPTLQGQDMYDLSMSIYKACISATKEMTGYDDKEELMRNCEKRAQDIMQSESMRRFYTAGRRYDYRASNISTILVNGVQEVVPDVKNIDGVAETKFACSAYIQTPRPCFERLDQKRICVTFTMVGSTKSRNTSVFSEVVAKAGQGNGVTSSTSSNVYRLNVKDPSNGLTKIYESNSSELNLSAIDGLDAEGLVRQACIASGDNDIGPHLQRVLENKKLETVQTITYESHYVGGGNGAGGKLTGRISQGGTIPITVSINFMYKDDSTADENGTVQELHGSMDYTFNITLTVNGANVTPTLLPAKFAPSGSKNNESTSTVPKITNGDEV